MNRTRIALMAAALTACLFSAQNAAAQGFDQNIVAIFGSGNPDTGWTTDVDNGITLALRAKNRETASTANVEGVYAEPAGYQAPNNNRARWNWEFSVDSGAVNLNTYDYYLGVDADPSVNIQYTVVDALAYFADDSYGNSTTLNGQGVEGTAATYASLFSIAQQSQNLVFWGQNPNLNATYDYKLYAVAKNAGPNGAELASVSITVTVGSGGATVQQLIDSLGVGATNHGDYVSAVNNLLKELYDVGVLNTKQKQTYLTAAAKSSVGK
jgi:hypothetical protein